MQNPPQPRCSARSSPRLDTTFGTQGTVKCNAMLLGNGVSASSIYAVALRQDRSLVLASSYADKALLIALNEDGSLDRTFNAQGYVSEDLDDVRPNEGIDVQLMPDGRLLLTTWLEGQDGYIPGFVMYHHNGQRDRTFGNNGVTIVELDSSRNARTRRSIMARSSKARNGTHSTPPIMTPEGQLLIPFVMDNFYGEPARTVLIRLKENGQLDTQFHDKGYIEITYENGPCRLDAIISLPARDLAQRLVLAGQYSGGALLAGVTLEGEADPAFGNQGFTALPGERAFLALDQTPDEELLASGYTQTPQQALAGWIVRFTSNGHLDQSFEPVTTPADSRNIRFERVQSNDDQQILCAGQIISPGPRFHGVLARYLHNGQPDDSFGKNGLFEELEGSFWDIIRTDNQLLAVGGQTDNSAGSVRRYHLTPET
ncbi:MULTISPECIES: NHL repeat-containing protein [unclassified Pseudomonas]|uniref:hypothetical protein n=1 Tax=Pseudomonas sp. A-R-26 TaxID=2832404 RepID=UPI001CBE27F8|nr:hypothetical protein [Pseudomonas sp. A-R-26]